jgi:hypothetical protein
MDNKNDTTPMPPRKIPNNAPAPSPKIPTSSSQPRTVPTTLPPPAALTRQSTLVTMWDTLLDARLCRQHR